MGRLIAREDARPALEAWLAEHGTVSAAAAAQPEAERLRGRGAVYVVPSPVCDGERWVVRHYHRGGAVASLLGDRYLRLGTPRPLREYRVGRALEEAGVPTVPHVGAAWYPAGPFRRGDLVTGYVPASRDLAAVLFPGRALDGAADGRAAAPAGAAPPGEAAAMRAAGSLFRTLHDHGVSHPDLNLKNVLVTTSESGRGPRALVLDLDRARVRGRLGERARRRMVGRFWRSLRKWEDRTGVRVDAALRDAFRSGYGR